MKVIVNAICRLEHDSVTLEFVINSSALRVRTTEPFLQNLITKFQRALRNEEICPVVCFKLKVYFNTSTATTFYYY